MGTEIRIVAGTEAQFGALAVVAVVTPGGSHFKNVVGAAAARAGLTAGFLAHNNQTIYAPYNELVSSKL